MYKKLSILLVAGLLLCAPMPAAAMSDAALEGTEFEVLIGCESLIKDYCGPLIPARDIFRFGDEFELGSLDDTFLGFGSQGDYTERGLFFRAELKVFNEDISRYEFKLRGITLLDQFIIGRMDIAYQEWRASRWMTINGTDAFFIGRRR